MNQSLLFPHNQAGRELGTLLETLSGRLRNDKETTRITSHSDCGVTLVSARAPDGVCGRSQAREVNDVFLEGPRQPSIMRHPSVLLPKTVPTTLCFFYLTETSQSRHLSPHPSDITQTHCTTIYVFACFRSLEPLECRDHFLCDLISRGLAKT